MDRIIVAASTHWDREWYRTFSEFRIRLCGMFTDLLDLLEKDRDFLCYTFDGQCVVLEDYLRVYPENRGRVERLVKEGKLVFGPLYNLPDEFIGSGEALVRNFLIGDLVCRAIGGKMNAGYLPDNFGHVSQIPQILNGVGIHSAFFFRGCNIDMVKHKEFIWKSPDGSEVLGEYMLLGYWSLKSWGKLGKSVKEQFREAYQALKKHSALDTFLLINGSDHLYQDPDFTSMLREVKEGFPDLKIENASVEAYAKIAREAAEGKELASVEGELRDFRYGPDPTSVTSTRGYLKKALYAALSELERYAEPLCTALYRRGESYPGGILRDAWKNILVSLGHDGISGCSSDEVIDDIYHYILHASQAARRLSEICLEKLAARMDTSALGRNEQYLSIYNPLPFRNSTIVDAVVHVERQPDTVDFLLLDTDGHPVLYEFLDQWDDAVTREFRYVSKQRIDRKCFRIRFYAEDIPALGIRNYIVKPLALHEKRQAELFVRIQNSDRYIENEFFRITVNPDASIRVDDKRENRTYDGLNTYVSRGEIGDEYQHVSALCDQHVFASLKGLTVVKNSPLSSSLRIHSSMFLPRSADRRFLSRGGRLVECPITTTVTVYRNSRRIDFKTEIDNRAIDQILYAKFPVRFKNPVEYSHVAFDRVERGNRVFPFDPDLKSTQSFLKPMQKYVGIKGNGGSLNVMARGLYEYHTKKTDDGLDLYVTLLRSTSYMFHGLPISWKDGQESTTPVVETFGSRGLGKNIFEYALTFDEQNLDFVSEQYHYPPRGFDVTRGQGTEKAGLPFLSLSSKKIMLAALKKHEYGDGIVVRLYNTEDTEQKVTVTARFPLRSCRLCNLLETPAGSLPCSGNTASVVLGPKKIVTLIVSGDKIL